MASFSRAFGTYAVSAVCLFFASSCSLQARKDAPSLILDLRSFTQLNGGASISAGGTSAYGLGDFACLAINVTGPGIDDSDPYREHKDPAGDFARTLAGSPCAYRGVVSPPIYHGAVAPTGELALKLPPGAVRVVQLIGVKSLASCQGGFIDPPDSAGGGGDDYFELARAEVRDFFQDRSVSLPFVDWSALTTAEREARDLDACHDGGSVGSAPVVAIANVMPAVASSTNGIVSLDGITVSGAYAEHCALVNATDPSGCTWSTEVLAGSRNVAMLDAHEAGLNKISFWARNAAGQISNRAESQPFYYDSSTLAPTYALGNFTVVPGGTGMLNVNLSRHGGTYAQYFCVKGAASPGSLNAGLCSTPDWQLWVPSYTYSGTPGASVYLAVFVKDNHGNVSAGGAVTGTAYTIPGP